MHPFSFTEEEIEEELRDTSTPNLCLLNFHHNDPIKPTALTSNNEKSKSAIQNSTEIPTTTQVGHFVNQENIMNGSDSLKSNF